MQFEWDLEKSRINLEKHGLAFEHAFQIFEDFHMTVQDVRKDYGEPRFYTMGTLGTGKRVVIIVHTRRGEKVRVISMRKANRREQMIFNKYKESYDET